MVRKSLRCRRASRSKIALRRIGKSTEHVIGIGRPHTYINNRMAMVCQEKKAISDCTFAAINVFRLR